MIKSLADINSRKVRRPVSILVLPIVLVAFVVDCLFGIVELAKKNVEYFIWVWKMPSGLKGQKSPKYPDKDTAPILMDDMTQGDIIAELDKLAADGAQMPFLNAEDAEEAGRRLDKKLVGVTSMKEAVSIMIEDIKENQPEKIIKHDQMDQEGTVEPLKKHAINPSLVNLVENRDKSAAEGGIHLVEPTFELSKEGGEQLKRDVEKPEYLSTASIMGVGPDPAEEKTEACKAYMKVLEIEHPIYRKLAFLDLLAEDPSRIDNPLWQKRTAEMGITVVDARDFVDKKIADDIRVENRLDGKTPDAEEEALQIAVAIATRSKIVPSGDDPHAAEEALANEGAEFQAKLDEIRKAPHTKEEIEEIKRQPDDVQRAKTIQRIAQRRVRMFLADTVLDGCIDKLADQLKAACPSMSVGDAKDLSEDIPVTNEVGAEIGGQHIGHTVDCNACEDVPETDSDGKVVDCECTDCVQQHEQADSPDQSGFHVIEQSQIKPDDLSEEDTDNG